MVQAILQAQFRSIRNMRVGAIARGGLYSLIAQAVWYGFWAFLAYGTYQFTSNGEAIDLVAKSFPSALLFMLLYWQVAPVLVASLGASLDLRKLLAYPVPPENLFWVEVILRLTTSAEMIFLLTGAATGLVRNPVNGGLWRLLYIVPPLLTFIAFNLLVAAGLRSLIERLLANRRVRELMVFLMVMMAAIPQIIVFRGLPGGTSMTRLISYSPGSFWPWTAAARLALATKPDWAAAQQWVLLAGWVAAAYAFGRWQFARSLRFDQQAAASMGSLESRREGSVRDILFRLPGTFLPDPIGAMVEKELRSLLRAPRFRLVFIMGFTFGLVVWLPMLLSKNGLRTPLGENSLAVLAVYAVTLMGQVTYWNSFGFDRSAVQVYFSLPVPFWKTLVAKNIAAAVLIALETLAVTAACLLTGLRPRPIKILEAFTVVPVVAVLLLAAGNVASVYLPRAMNPERASQSSSGKSQALILVVYPLTVVPVMLAYLARYAFQSQLAFYGLLGLFLAVGITAYYFSMETAVAAAEERREQIVAELTRSQGPVVAD
jgi:ABC-2 type transport system permease protein